MNGILYQIVEEVKYEDTPQGTKQKVTYRRYLPIQ